MVLLCQKKKDFLRNFGIQKLGARGIVEIDNTIKIIFQKDAKKLKKCIEQLNEDQ